MGTHMPVETIEADQLPVESPITYDEICKVIGHLYLDSLHRINTFKEQHNSIVASLSERINELNKVLIQTNKELDILNGKGRKSVTPSTDGNNSL